MVPLFHCYYGNSYLAAAVNKLFQFTIHSKGTTNPRDLSAQVFMENTLNPEGLPASMSMAENDPYPRKFVRMDIYASAPGKSKKGRA